MEKETRLNKYLSESGICSRREADRLIEKNLVCVDGKPAVPGQRVTAKNKITVNGKSIGPVQEKVFLLFNKPKGIVCTAEKREPNNLMDYLNYPVRITYAGRLDKDSEGLMLLTNDGDLIDKMMRARNRHEKEYRVTVDHPITDEFLKDMAGGVPILDTVTRPCEVTKVSKNTFRIVLTQGLNRQIRRMCEYFHYNVVQLKRVRIMNLHLGNLPEGQTRPLTNREKEELYHQLEQE
ncbi:MAG: pseudouridine synthase [Lachnospiraceae bacterium]|nr:pseudouridine synthase [Lachnospiraceae bacterium]